MLRRRENICKNTQIASMPKRPRSHQLEDISRNRLRQIFNEVGWTVEDLAKDYGEDLLVRIFDKGKSTPLTFFVQAKATDNLARYLNRNKSSLSYPVSSKHLRHWRKFQEPVLLMLWDSKSDKTFWTCVQTALTTQLKTIDLTTQQKNIRISCDSWIDGRGLDEIRSIAHSRYSHVELERKGARILVEMLQRESGGKVEYSSYGVLSIERNGGLDVSIFGRLADKLNDVAISKSISLEKALELAINDLSKAVEKFKNTGTFPVLNKKTGQVEYLRMTQKQFVHHIKKYLASKEQE